MVLKPLKIKMKKDKKEPKKVDAEVFKDLSFNLSMVYGRRDEVEVSESGEYSVSLNSYEKYKKLYYYSNITHYILTNSNVSALSKGKHILSMPFFLSSNLNKSIKNKVSNIIKEFEAKANKLDAIREKIELSKTSMEYPSFDLYNLIYIPSFFAEFLTLGKALNTELKKYLNSIDVLSLKKSYWIKNFELFFDKIGIKNNSIKEFTELLIFDSVIDVCRIADANLSKYSPDTLAKYLGNKFKLPQNALNEYESILFHLEYDPKRLVSVYIEHCFLYACLRKYISNEKALKSYLPTLKDSKLSLDNFSYIEQIDYLKRLLKNSLDNRKKGINILLYGEPGTGKTSFATALMKSLGTNNYVVPGLNLISEEKGNKGIESTKGVNDLRKHKYLTMQTCLKSSKNSIILYDEAEDFFMHSPNEVTEKFTINEILENNCVPTIWTTNSLWCMSKAFIRRFTYVLNIDNLPKDIYKKLFEDLLKKYSIFVDDELKNLFIQYKPTIGIVEKILSNYKLSKSKDSNQLKKDLLDSLKGLNYGDILKKLPINSFKFNPNLLNTSVDLIDLTASIKQNGRLDFSLLLYGVPGSSKTSYARYLAEELGLNVISKTYTELSSMWVGETEKNIARLFEEAERDKALIILDECDVLLQDRTRSVRSWETSQTEALLTAMDNHPYPFVMTTNLYDNLDPAVMRRVLYKVKHDYLTDDQVKMAFEYFFNIKLKENLHLSRLTSGDFAVIKKQAEFQSKLSDKTWLVNKLTEEMNQKKMLNANTELLI